MFRQDEHKSVLGILMKNGFQSPKNNPRQVLGRLGEERAAAFLVEKGFVCLARNWRSRAGEIDLIMERGNEIRFVEVKARRTRTYGTPEEAVTAEKLAHLRAAAEAWIAAQTFTSLRAFQFDVVTVFLPGTQNEQLEWIQDVII
jgi:putative endonuclease